MIDSHPTICVADFDGDEMNIHFPRKNFSDPLAFVTIIQIFLQKIKLLAQKPC